MVRVRIAPSPTGIPHIGNTRTALFNYLFARHNKGKFILRIEDTDRKRIVKGAQEAIVEILDFLGISPDETYTQSERIDEYKKYAKILLDKKLAYEKEGAVWMKIPQDQIFSWTDLVGNKSISFKSQDIEEFVIIKSDGFPTYHLASVVDDHLMEISHVIRGDEWISSTPKHLLLYKSFSWALPFFAHLPVILGKDKKKLSKRDGAKSVLDYRNEGYLRNALLNFMVLLGWNPGGDNEIFSISEMIKLFDLKDVNTSSPVFDIQKLEWMNSVYIRKLAIIDLKKEIEERFKDKLKNVSEEILHSFLVLAQSRIKTLNEFYELIKPFIEKLDFGLDGKEKNIGKKLLDGFLKISNWRKDGILTVMKKAMSQENIRMPIVYKILTGKESGLPLPESLEIVGKEKVIEMLKRLDV
ncbi:MAG: glutamate--tRNA ligase family protein [Candidatus Levybacteria bacterium]|nr:glutamate--tRNA ligase family protein [Candidatus Levybacteria bacterium]